MSDIDEIITYRSEEHPNLLWLEVKTKDGVTGLGETFFAAEALEAYIHSNLAPIVLGLPSEDIGMVHLKSDLMLVLLEQVWNLELVLPWI